MLKEKSKKKIVIICGPTASGKSSLAMDIALEIGGEIINADSMQIYKEIPILTASPTKEDKSKIKHYLYNFISLDDDYSVAKFASDAMIAINQVIANSRIPIIVGGTGLYINSLINGISSIPDIPIEVREKSRGLFDKLGNEKFYQKLCELDPKVSEKLHFSNSQRLIRAYEVFIHTNRSIYDFHNEKSPAPLDGWYKKIIFLDPNREELYKRCDRRLNEMVSNGVIEEIKKTKSVISNQSVKAIGYQEFAKFIDGESTIYDAILEASQRTRNYAKRQVTWFRNQLDYDQKISNPKIDEIELW